MAASGEGHQRHRPGGAAAAPSESASIATFGEFRFDARSGLLFRDGDEIFLAPRVSGVLRLVLERAGTLVSREELLETVWKHSHVADSSLSEAVATLRQALGDDPRQPTYIETIHRRGYRFIAPIGLAAAAPARGPSLVRAYGLNRYALVGLLLVLAAAIILRPTLLDSPGELTRLTEEFVGFGSTLPGGSGPTLSSALSPDGSQLAYLSAPGEGLFLRDLEDGGENRLIAIDAETDEFLTRGSVSPPVWSPDGRWIAVPWATGNPDGWEWEARVIEAHGPARQTRTLYEAEHDGFGLSGWSSDSKSLYIFEFLPATDDSPQASRILEVPIDDGEPREVLTLESAGNPRLSPDGERFAFESRVERRAVVMVAGRNGGPRVCVSDPSVQAVAPLWSPDGRYLLYRRFDGATIDFVAVELEGLEVVSEPVSIKRVTRLSAQPLSWSKDGWLLWGDNDTGSSVYRLPVDPLSGEAVGEPALFTEQFRGRLGIVVVSSHSGDYVGVLMQGMPPLRRGAYVLSRDERWEIRLPQRYTGYPEILAWSEDDSRVLVEAWTEERELAFLWVEWRTGQFEEILTIPRDGLSDAQASRDGRRVVLLKGRTSPHPDNRVMVLDLADGRLQDTGLRGMRFRAAWSPNGESLIVLRHQEDRTQHLLIVPLDGSPPRQLHAVDEPATGSRMLRPDWSPDGRFIVFRLLQNRPRPPYQIMVVPAEGPPNIRMVYSFGSEPGQINYLRWSGDGSALFFMKAIEEHRLYKLSGVLETIAEQLRQ